MHSLSKVRDSLSKMRVSFSKTRNSFSQAPHPQPNKLVPRSNAKFSASHNKRAKKAQRLMTTATSKQEEQ
jgi:hypothetical protein